VPRELPLIRRKAMLCELLPSGENGILVADRVGRGVGLFRAVRERDREGIVAKWALLRYRVLENVTPLLMYPAGRCHVRLALHRSAGAVGSEAFCLTTHVATETSGPSPSRKMVRKEEASSTSPNLAIRATCQIVRLRAGSHDWAIILRSS